MNDGIKILFEWNPIKVIASIITLVDTTRIFCWLGRLTYTEVIGSVLVIVIFSLSTCEFFLRQIPSKSRHLSFVRSGYTKQDYCFPRYTVRGGIQQWLFPYKGYWRSLAFWKNSRRTAPQFFIMDRRSSQQSEGSVGSGSEYSGFKYNHHNKKGEDKPLPPAVLVYHESARSIVFRDHVRRVSIDDKRFCNTQKDSDEPNINADGSIVSVGSSSMIQEEHDKHSTSTATPTQVIIANYTPVIEPLAALEVMPGDDFTLLRESNPFTSEGELNEQVWENMSVSEKEVVTLLKQERAVVKTIKNADWTSFLKKFQPTDDKIQHEAHPSGHNHHQSDHMNNTHRDESEFSFHSFVTSTTLLPPCGKKMRCYGSVREYNVGVVFAIPDHTDDKEEDEKAKLTKTWSWPSGYSAKTEFNIGHNGRLINGREEALVPLSGLRKMNHDYCHKTDFGEVYDIYIPTRDVIFFYDYRLTYNLYFIFGYYLGLYVVKKIKRFVEEWLKVD